MAVTTRIPTALIATLRGAQHICVLTGAGISAESGVPTFRDAQSGLWEKYDPLDLATPEAFLRDPKLIWRWYRWRRELVAKAQPNPAHQALATFATLVPRLTLVTQNVDGLHQRAGSTDVIEFHGNLFDDRCFAEDRIVDCTADADVPICPGCGSNVRPGVVWFGEAIPEQALDRSFAAAADCDVFLSIGTSSLVFPAAGLAEVANEAGAVVIEVNPNPTGMSAGFDYAIAGNAGSVLPELIDSLTD
ncbi:MAG: NAD-dependent deacylase [Gammaproteobacteria bacterium]|nr:NAD-dependent deacylase [Gammaproteobacteria bacterium]MDH3751310.1 NAD-dependent deacylase [Gammaproteobacteria bacterium]